MRDAGFIKNRYGGWINFQKWLEIYYVHADMQSHYVLYDLLTGSNVEKTDPAEGKLSDLLPAVDGIDDRTAEVDEMMTAAGFTEEPTDSEFVKRWVNQSSRLSIEIGVGAGSSNWTISDGSGKTIATSYNDFRRCVQGAIDFATTYTPGYSRRRR
jgi:hypothetical protein